MNSKSLLIAIAAFTLTATGAQAYGGAKLLGRTELTEDQISAIEEARELRRSGDQTAARDRLVAAGIDEDALRSIGRAIRDSRADIRTALENDDYNAFREAAASLPIGDIITSRDDFEQFREAHLLRQSGDWRGADDILSDLGVAHGRAGGGWLGGERGRMMFELSDEQREALAVARQSNDRATIQAIFDEAGYEPHSRQMFR